MTDRNLEIFRGRSVVRGFLIAANNALGEAASRSYQEDIPIEEIRAIQNKLDGWTQELGEKTALT